SPGIVIADGGPLAGGQPGAKSLNGTRPFFVFQVLANPLRISAGRGDSAAVGVAAVADDLNLAPSAGAVDVLLIGVGGHHSRIGIDAPHGAVACAVDVAAAGQVIMGGGELQRAAVVVQLAHFLD